MSSVRAWLISPPLIVGAFACNTLLGNSAAVLNDDDASVSDASSTLPDATTQPNVESDQDATTGPDATVPGTGGCGDGQKKCDGVCVDMSSPQYGCGDSACVACSLQHATATCGNASCLVGSCDPGFSDCNGMAADGCETDLSRSTSCGSCNAKCGAAAPNCAPVGPSFECTTGCPSNAPLLCGTQCADPQTSVAHCGGCNTPCAAIANATVACTTGACTFTCAANYHACGQTCVPTTDPAMCGPMCTACPTPPSATATCVANACAFTCATGTADCDAVAANGCEAVLASDPMNCGACGVVCANGGSCVKSKCQTPDAGSGSDSGTKEGGAEAGP